MSNFDLSKYRNGYSNGVGGVVLYANKVLLVRSKRRGEWSIPGGFVEHGETIDVAVKREITEEAGVQAEIQGLIAARNRISANENSAYFIFLLRAKSEESQADDHEVDAARFFTLAEAKALPGLNSLTDLLITRVLEGKAKVLEFQAHPTVPTNEYVLFV